MVRIQRWFSRRCKWSGGSSLLNTFVAASAGIIGWLVVEKLKGGHATSLGMASGIVAGLVAITPAAGFVGGLASVVFGLVAGAVCYFAISLKTDLATMTVSTW